METKTVAQKPVAAPAPKPAPASPAPAAVKVEVSPEVRAQIEAELREKIRQEEVDKLKKAQTEPGPRYRMSQRAYLNDMLVEEGQEATYKGVPGPHMIPLNASAKEAAQKAGYYDPATEEIQPAHDPILALTKVSG